MFARLEKNVEKLSLQELIFAKEVQRDYISQNIPISLSAFALTTVSWKEGISLWMSLIFIWLIVFLIYNYSVAKKNIETYNIAIIKKMKESLEEESKYREEILLLLKSIQKA